MRLTAEFTPSGRLTRSGFLLRHLVGLPVGLFVCIACAQILGPSADVLPSLGLTLFLVSVWSRRLHDRGRSAWLLLWAAVPVVGALYLIIECAWRGSSTSERFGSPPGVRHDYLTVQG
jgi:uncharacterized membrane protein YhaH (DUF805 family)